MISFKDARRIVTENTGLPTEEQGYEDLRDYSVLPVYPQPYPDDLVTLVSKDEGVYRQVVYFNEMDKLDKMVQITDTSE